MKIGSANTVLPFTPPPQADAAAAKRSMDEAIARNMQELWSSQLDPDQKLTFEYGKESFTLQGKDQPHDKSLLDDIKKFCQSAVQEINLGVKSGPCLALSLAGGIVKPLVTMGLNEEQVGGVDKIYAPAMRGLCLGLSAVQFIEGWKKINKKHADNKPVGTADFLSMGINGVHVLTCAAGIAGAVAGTVNRSFLPLGNVGLGVALAGDILAFGANHLQYVANRSRIAEAPQANK